MLGGLIQFIGSKQGGVEKKRKSGNWKKKGDNGKSGVTTYKNGRKSGGKKPR